MEPGVFFSILVFAGMIVVLGVLWTRHRNQEMEHQERLAALEKGTSMPAGPAPAPWSPRVYLLRGLIWTFVGAALTVALLGAAISDKRTYHESADQMAWHARNVAQTLQIPIEQAREIVARDEATRLADYHGAPAAIALFGLIPLAVGLAYLVFYRSEAASASPANRL